MFARAKYVAGKWTKRVGAHAQMGLPRPKLAQAMTRVMTTFLQHEVRESVVSTIVRVHVHTNFA